MPKLMPPRVNWTNSRTVGNLPELR
jgi:hypothetical protein